MILSFSVPDTPKYRLILDWYQNVEKNERSRQFRNIFLEYLVKPHHTIESNATNHISPAGLENIKLDRIDIIGGSNELDLDSKLDLIGNLGGE